MSRQQDQLNLPPALLTNREGQAPALTKREPHEDVGVAASFLFDKALSDAGLTTGEAAHLMGVSENMVNRMRSPNYRECVSLVQLLRCGPSVTWKFHVALHHKQQFGQRALREALQALSLVGVGIE